jgi:hypothetical protein
MLNLARSMVRFGMAGLTAVGLSAVTLSCVTLSCVALSCVGCAAPQSPAEKPPSYFRSPTLDYQDPPRSASDGEVMGANKQSPDETLQASPTNEHLAPGWEVENGMLVASPEARKAGHGSHAQEPGCEPAQNVKSPEANASPDKKAADSKDPVRKALRPVCPSETPSDAH